MTDVGPAALESLANRGAATVLVCSTSLGRGSDRRFLGLVGLVMIHHPMIFSGLCPVPVRWRRPAPDQLLARA